MKKLQTIKFLIFLFVLSVVSFSYHDVYAKTVSADNIEPSSYVIGSHVFTRDVNKATGYEGKLTTNLIMLASKTIESSDLSNMIIYYKSASSKWINGLTGEEITPPSSFTINYTNLQLEEDNTTVSSPKTPFFSLNNGPVAIVANSSLLKYDLNIFVDDVENPMDHVDGVEVEVQLSYNGQDIERLKYDLKADTSLSKTYTVLESYPDATIDTVNKQFSLQIGKQYHLGQLSFEVNPNYLYMISARSYVLDGNGKKVYSYYNSKNLFVGKYDFYTSIENDLSNPDYLKEEGDYVYYKLKVTMPKAYVLKVSPERFGYVIYNGETKDSALGVQKITDNEFIYRTKKGSVDTLTAVLGYYDETGIFHEFKRSKARLQKFVLDTRELATPILNGDQSGLTFEWHQQNGELLKINNFSVVQNDYMQNDFGADIYQMSFWSDLAPDMFLIEKLEHSDSTAIMPEDGTGYYDAKFYATKQAGKKIYSSLSDVLTLVRTPEIVVSEVKDGQVEVSIANASQYLVSHLTGGEYQFNIYQVNDSGEDTLLDVISSSHGKVSIPVQQNMKIYAKTFDKDYYSAIKAIKDEDAVYVYSAKSNEVNISID